MRELAARTLRWRRSRAVPATALGEPSASTESFVRHELKNTLTAAALHAAMLSDTDEPHRELSDVGLRAIREALQHAIALSDRLGGEPVRGHPPPRDAADVLSSCARLLRPVIERAGVLETDLPASVGVVALDERELSELTINLLLNAAEALTGEGSVRISARKLAMPPRVEFEVSDDGCGIGEEILDRVFTAGFSSKPNGSGLGLARVNQIVKKVNGRIEVSSVPGAGTLFSVELPLERGNEPAGAKSGIFDGLAKLLRRTRELPSKSRSGNQLTSRWSQDGPSSAEP